jgi:hypothetical protein
LPFLSSITPRFRFRCLAGLDGFIAMLPDGCRPRLLPAYLHLVLDASLTHSFQPSGVVSTSTSMTM